MSLLAPGLLAVAGALPLVLLVVHEIRRRRTMHWSAYLEDDLEVGFWPRKPAFPSLPGHWLLRGVLLGVAGGSLGVALAGPAVGVREVPVPTPAPPLVVVLDVSRSMEVADVPWGRLGQARLQIRRLAHATRGRPVGLVVFAGEAYPLLPPTPDRDALLARVDAVSPEMLTRQGTALARGLREALALVADLPPETRKAGPEILLFTDGEDHGLGEEALEAAREVRSAGGVLSAVLVGTRQGGRVPPRSAGVRALMQRTGPAETGGEVAVSRANPDLLARLARAGGGEVVTSEAPGATDRLLRRVEVGTGGEDEESTRVVARELWSLFVVLALVALSVEMALANRIGTDRRETRETRERRERRGWTSSE